MSVGKLQVYVTTLPEVDPAEGLRQVTTVPFGSVINQLTAPVGATATPYPVTVVVR
jgi:hypothetical protein